MLPLLLQLLAAGPTGDPTPAALAGDPPNLLVVVVDDLGRDTLSAYGLADAPPPTPVIHELSALGVRFDRAWAHPICSPSRAALLTGRYGFRVGIGDVIPQTEDAFGLDPRQPTIADLLGQHGYRTAAFGKWHLEGGSDDPTHPNELGFAHYDGCLSNLDIATDPWTYDLWPRVVDGVQSVETEYLTSTTITSAREWIDSGPEPWFAYVALHAVHSPFHWPPPHLHSVDPTAVPEPELAYWQHRAMVESVDRELGRLVKGLGIETGETTLVLVSDNGTASPGVEPPFPPDKAKSTLFEGGVGVPLIVVGAGVGTSGASDGLVHLVDLYATLAQLGGAMVDAEAQPLDSISLLPYLADPRRPSLRAANYTERFRPNGPGLGQPPVATIGAAEPGAPPFCQTDLGFGNFADPTALSLCGADGQGLVPGNLVQVALAGAAPNAAGLLLVGTGIDPTPFLDGLLVPAALDFLLPLVTDAAGTWSDLLPGELFVELAPDTLIAQAVTLDPTAPSGNDLSNALALLVPPFDRKAVVDEAGYKLIATAWNGGRALYHLPSDPFEDTDLLAGGTDALSDEERQALEGLEAALAAVLAPGR